MTGQRVAEEIIAALRMLESQECDSIAHLRGGLTRYLTDRIPTGGFLRHCLENDLSGAVGHAAPEIAMTQLRTLTQLLNTSFPAIAWGSPAKVAAWLGEEKLGEETT